MTAMSFLCDESRSKATRAVEALAYASTLLDIVDSVFDYVQVAELAQYQKTRFPAAGLGVCTTIALLLELVVKTQMRRLKDKSTAEGFGDFDMNDFRERDSYIMLSGLMELVIFLVEDATTVFVWWQTGTYNSNDPVAQANLITTIISAVGAATALLYGLIRFVGGGGCTGALFVGIPAAPFIAALTFWAWLALTNIQGGDSYACIGSCVTTNATTTTTTTLAGSDALVFGSDSSFGSGGGGAGEGGKDVGLNHAAIGVYVVGWIVAGWGGVLATVWAFQIEGT